MIIALQCLIDDPDLPRTASASILMMCKGLWVTGPVEFILPLFSDRSLFVLFEWTRVDCDEECWWKQNGIAIRGDRGIVFLKKDFGPFLSVHKTTKKFRVGRESGQDTKKSRTPKRPRSYTLWKLHVHRSGLFLSSVWKPAVIVLGVWQEWLWVTSLKRHC